jgi:PAS domain S-box-containing protein
MGREGITMTEQAMAEEVLRQELDRLCRELAVRDRDIAALREGRERIAQVLDTTHTGYVIIDGKGLVRDANPEYVRLTGHERLEQVLGRSVTEWTAEYDRERNAQEVGKCLQQGFVRNLVVDYVNVHGQITPVEINASLLRSTREPVIVTVCRDVSERRYAEACLERSERQYRSTIDSMSELIHVVDTELRIVLMNRAGLSWLRDLGLAYDPDGRTLFEVFPFLPERVREEYARVFRDAQPMITEERTEVGARSIVTETRKIPVVDGGSVVRIVTVVRDITVAEEAKERLLQAEKMEALGHLAGGIAHDFNNHLTAILGCADMLRYRVQDPALREMADVIANAAGRSSELTHQLLAFARKSPLRRTTVDVHELILEVTSILKRLVDGRIAIMHRLDAPACRVAGDASQLHSALLNLGINARDAMPDGGLLTFATDLCPESEQGGRWLRIRVEDTGVGMGEETRKRLFEPFFTTKPSGEGTGMGLAAVYGTVVRHGGTVQVSSSPGAGSEFVVALPLLEPDDFSEPQADATTE